VSYPSHSSWFDHTVLIIFGEQYKLRSSLYDFRTYYVSFEYGSSNREHYLYDCK
jgi:hypothetical protein